MELGVALSIGLAYNHLEGCREERNNLLPTLAMDRTRKTGFVSAKLIQVKFDGKCFLLVHLWGSDMGFLSQEVSDSSDHHQTIISVTLDEQSSSLLEEQTR